jgi:hypothetical protein
MRLFAKGGGDWLLAEVLAETDRADDRVKRVIKAAVSGATMDNNDLATIGAIGAYLDSLATDSFVIAIQNDNAFVKPPLNTNTAVSTLNGTAYLRLQGAPIPLTRLTLNSNALKPIVVSALGVVTDELVRNAGLEAEALFNREMRKAAGLVIDSENLALIVDVSTPLRTSTGMDPLGDLRALLQHINATGASRPYFVTDPNTANSLSLFSTANGPLLFEEMTPRGGMIAGVPVLVSGAVPLHHIYGIDAGSIACNVDTITLDQSNEAVLQMADNPTGDVSSGSGTTAVSMFQTNSVALRLNITFGVQRLRTSAIAIVEHTNYGEVS